MARRFEKLFEPIRIGKMEVKNRIVMCPMGVGYASVPGAVTERMINYYTERAKGGVGLIILEGTCVEGSLGRLGRIPRTLIDRDQFIAGLHDLVENVHHYDTKIAIQFQHGGPWARLEPGKQPISASETVRELFGLNARALSTAEIEELEEIYAEAARRAQVAGFDAIDINGGAGFLIAQFLSPLTNKRTDGYGGDLEGRMRFITELIGCIQQKVGKDYPIIFDHPVDECVEGGITLKESKVMAQKLEKLGVAAFRMHSGVRDTRLFGPPAAVPQGTQVHYAEETKKVLEKAKVMVGRQIQDPQFANEVIRQGKADLIVLGRPLLADPMVPKKWTEGKLDEIRRCIRCNKCRWNESRGLSVACTVNAALGKEKEYQIVAAKKPKRVLVVGGGPGGMEAARVAALRGHKVILYEKSKSLGGQLNLACVAPHKEEIKNLNRHLTNQIRKLGVHIELGKEVTKELVRRGRPEVIILATGATPLVLDIPGIKKKIVSTAWDILFGKAKAGEKVVVVGGGIVGLETAEYLSEKGRKVTVVELLSEPGIDMEPSNKMLLLERLAKLGVSILTGTQVEEITEGGIVVANGQKRWTLEADTVVLAVGAGSNKNLQELKKENKWKVFAIGDCVTPRSAFEAIHEGYWVGNQI